MTPLILGLLGFTIVCTSFLSGVFGMAGGMILLGVLLLVFDVSAAMILLGITQFAANGWRVVLWWRFIRWPIFFGYVAGALVAFAVMRIISFVPDKVLIYLALGIVPFAVELIPASWRPNIEWRGIPVVTGFLMTVLQLVAGIGGTFLDLFFQKSTLDRKTTVGTKAVTQTFGHVLRVVYFGSLAASGDVLPLYVYGGAIALAIVGTSLGPIVLERLTDAGFRVWTRRIVMLISAVYLIRGIWLWYFG